MNQKELFSKIQQLLDDAKTAVLSTVDEDGAPHMRWMTPGILRSRPGVIFAVTSPEFSKVRQMTANPEVEWMFQNRALTEMVNLQGRMNVLDNPSIKAEVIQAVGKRLTVFWRAAQENTDFLVLETVPSSATYKAPMRGIKEIVTFEE